MILVLAAAPASAQTLTGTITGSILDPTGGAVVGAAVVLTHGGTGVSREARSNESGYFAFTAAPPGAYILRCEITGFKAVERTGIVLTAGERLSLGDIELALGSVGERIVVEARGAAVNTEGSETTALLSSSQLNDMMVQGRDVVNLLRVLPGVSQISGGGETLGGLFGNPVPNISGTRNNWVTMSADGQVGSSWDSTSYFNAITSVESMAEVKVVLNSYHAEYGRNMGPAINIITKSGGKDFHGSAYWYKRHESLNANDFFNNRSARARPALRWDNYGITVGGPVFIPGRLNRDRNKLFFFYSQEEWRTKQPLAVLQRTVPTELERRGDFSQTVDQAGRLITVIDPAAGAAFPGNLIPAGRINANGRALLNVFPLPNATNRALTLGAYNYEFQDIRIQPKRGQWLRLDYHPTDRDSVSVYSRRWWGNAESYTTAGISIPLLPYNYEFPEAGASAAWTRTITPALVNEWGVGFRGLKERADPITAAKFAPVLRATHGMTLKQFSPANNPFGFVPAMTFGSVVPAASNLTFDARIPINAGNTRFHLTDNLSYVRGSHTFKLGLYLERNWASEGPRAASFSGNFDFSSDTSNPLDSRWPFATALLGNFRSYTEADAKINGKGTNYSIEWFVQDTWKATRRLTLDYGVRFYSFVPWLLSEDEGTAFALERYNPAKSPQFYRPGLDPARRRLALNPITGAFEPAVLIGAFVPGSGDPDNGLVLATDRSYPAGFRVRHGVQIAPRVGFAWDVFGTGKTAIRGGFGITKQTQPAVGLYTENMGNNLYNSRQLYYGNLDTFLGASGVRFPRSIAAWEKDDAVPSVYNYSFSVQQDVGAATVVDIAYVGNVGRHLLQRQDLNTLPYGARFLPANLDSTTGRALPDNFLRPYPGWDAINYLETSGTSNYNSLQATANRRFAKGVQFGIAYTWSKAMGLSGAEAGPISRYIARKVWNYGLLDFDQVHMFTANYLWKAPKLTRVWKAPGVRWIFDDWEIAGITTFASGNPRGVSLTTSDGADLTGGGDGARPLVIAAPQLARSERGFARWFNTAAFARPQRGDFGNAAATVYRGPGVANWNFTVMKDFPLGRESRFLRFRWEMYNVFNHTQYNATDGTARFNPAGAQINGQFGMVTSTRAPRIIQASLSLRF
jgi:hypothetical protein